MRLATVVVLVVVLAVSVARSPRSTKSTEAPSASTSQPESQDPDVEGSSQDGNQTEAPLESEAKREMCKGKSCRGGKWVKNGTSVFQPMKEAAWGMIKDVMVNVRNIGKG